VDYHDYGDGYFPRFGHLRNKNRTVILCLDKRIGKFEMTVNDEESETNEKSDVESSEQVSSFFFHNK